MTDEDWNGITVQESLNVSWGEVPSWKKNPPSKTPPPYNKQVKVITLSGNGNLENLRDIVNQQFIFNRSFRLVVIE